MPAQIGPSEPHIRALPLVAIHLTDRCNSRCIACDWWRTGRAELSQERFDALLPELAALGTTTVLITGGEPLVHRRWSEMAGELKSRGHATWLLTSGLALAKHAARVAGLFDAVTVSLDGATRETYAAIRGVDAFDVVCDGIRELARAGRPPGLRVTVQRLNAAELAGIVRLGRDLGAREVSFLAADVGNGAAFGREPEFVADVVPRGADLEALGRSLQQLDREHAADFASGFIAERPAKLRRLLQYYAALDGRASLPPVRCNAPEFSAVVGVDGRVSPCFFIPGPAGGDSLRGAVDAPAMRALREDIRVGRAPQCRACVCPLWREPAELDAPLVARA